MIADLRFALRQLTKAPGFTAVMVVTLALGIGSCTAIFSVVNGVVLKPLPYPEAHRVVTVGEVETPGVRPVGGSVAPLNFLDWRAQNTVFEHLAASRGSGFNFMLPGGEPQRFIGLRVSANFFDVLGVAPLQGRSFTVADDHSGAERVVLLSHRLWQGQFGGTADALGRTVLLNGESHTVIGVMPEWLQRATAYDFWVPLAFQDAEIAPTNRGAHYLNVLGRLKPDVTVARAQAEMNTIAERLARQYPDTNRDNRVTVMAHLDYIAGPTRPVLLALLGAVGALLLIACANVANLLLARATTRAREIAVRTALGASRWRVVRQLLIESFVVAVAGGALGLLAARWGLDALMLFAPSDLPRTREIGLDATVLGFATALIVVTGLGFGLVPALQTARVNLIEGLKDGARGSGEAAPRRRLRNAFVVAEIALSLVLLSAAGLLMRSFARLQSVDPGFRTEHVTTITLSASPAQFPTPAQRIAAAEAYAERFRELPGVVTVGAIDQLPLSGGENVFGFTIEGRPAVSPADMPSATYYTASAGYFETIGIGLVRGRTFTPQDSLGAPRVAIISQGLAEKHFRGEDPIGRRINLTNGPENWREIVGVVRDVRHLGLDDGRALQVYEPLAQTGATSFHFVVRSAAANPALPPALRAAARDVNPEQPVIRLAPMESFVTAALSRQRFGMTLFGVFSALALVLAAVGIYGVMAYTVSQRTAEFGVRIALGAQARDVRRLVFRQALQLAGIGLVIGLALTLLASRLLESLLFNVSARDPLTLTVIAALLVAVALFACWFPARRAARIDPIVALRSE